jgi:hypothetical protein
MFKSSIKECIMYCLPVGFGNDAQILFFFTNKSPVSESQICKKFIY